MKDEFPDFSILEKVWEKTTLPVIPLNRPVLLEKAYPVIEPSDGLDLSKSQTLTIYNLGNLPLVFEEIETKADWLGYRNGKKVTIEGGKAYSVKIIPEISALSPGKHEGSVRIKISGKRPQAESITTYPIHITIDVPRAVPSPELTAPPRRLYPFPALIRGILFLIILVIFLWVWSKATIKITSKPSGFVYLYSENPSFTKPLYEGITPVHWKVRPGKYKVLWKIQQKRFKKPIKISWEQALKHKTIPLSKILPGKLNIRTHPWTHVSLNGVKKETPAIFQEISPGHYKIKIENSLYFISIQEEIDVKPGETTHFSKTFPLSRLIITTTPGAEIFLNDRKIGEDKIDREILQGTYRLKLQKEGFNPLKTNIFLKENIKNIYFSLEPDTDRAKKIKRKLKLVKIYLNMGQYESAIKKSNEVLKLDPNNLEAKGLIKRAKEIKEEMKVAQVFLDKGWYDGAIEVLEKLREKNPGNEAIVAAIEKVKKAKKAEKEILGD